MRVSKGQQHTVTLGPCEVLIWPLIHDSSSFATPGDHMLGIDHHTKHVAQDFSSRHGVIVQLCKDN